MLAVVSGFTVLRILPDMQYFGVLYCRDRLYSPRISVLRYCSFEWCTVPSASTHSVTAVSARIILRVLAVLRPSAQVVVPSTRRMILNIVSPFFPNSLHPKHGLRL